MALYSTLRISGERFVLPHQVHGTSLLTVDEQFLKLTTLEKAEQLEGIDALVTCCQEACIAVSTADCVPVLLYSPERKVAAAVHAGWRGTLKKITAKTATVLIDTYGADPERLIAVIGPSISQAAFEVGNEVYSAFSEADFDMLAIADMKNGKWHIDLWKANRLQLQALRIKSTNIHTTGICTYANAQDFFSARRLGTASGRIVSGIIIRQP